MNKTLKPEQVTILIDTREQNPVDVAPLKSARATLATGDYSAKGLEHVIAVERKEISDLMTCIGRERERFERELHRMLAYPCRAIVVECDWTSIELKRYRSDIHPNAALGSLYSWIAMGMPIIMAGTHERAGQIISRLIFSAARRRYLECHQFIETLDTN